MGAYAPECAVFDLLLRVGSGRVFSLLIHDDFPGATHLFGGGATVRPEFFLDARSRRGGAHCGCRPSINCTIPPYGATILIAQFERPAYIRPPFQDLSFGS